MVEQAYYEKGFQKSVSDTHSWRTVANSSKFVLDVLQPNYKVLDVGCGPGSITIDFAQNYLTNGGSIIGIEPTHELIDLANENKNKTAPNLTNITFQEGSIYKIPFDDNTFDLVHAHQVVIHLENPVNALKELQRVTKPGGFVCVKDADLESIIASPEKYDILKQYYVLKAKNALSTDIRAGRTLREKAIKAGYKPDDITTTMSHWLMCDDRNSKLQWAELAKNRILNGGEVLFPKDAKKNDELKAQMVEKWDEWKQDENSLLEMTHFEIIYKKG